jgi:WD40 repeat protein
LSIDDSGNVLLAGSVNGDITLIDRRISTECTVATFSGSTGRILSAQFSNADCTEFTSGSAGGDLLLWDIRNANPVLKIESAQGPFTSFKIHDQVPLMAW